MRNNLHLMLGRVIVVVGMVLFPSVGLTATQFTNAPDAGQVRLQSPDGKIQVAVTAQGPLTYTVTVDGQPIVRDCVLGLKFHDGITLGQNVQLVKVVQSAADSTWENRFGKCRQVRDHHTELRLCLQERSAGDRPFEVIFRAFDDGVGFRYVIPAAGAGSQDFRLDQELTQFSFPGNYRCFAGANGLAGTPKNPGGYAGPQEAEFFPTHLADLPTAQVRLLPVLVETPVAWVAVLEAALYDWAGLWLNRLPDARDDKGYVTLTARLAPRLDHEGLVKSTFPRNSPWRILLIGRQPGQLIESNLVLNLATPCLLGDTSWVKPGLASWDWWNSTTHPSTATYKDFIQFSADMGWPYFLIDGGWSDLRDISRINSAVDMDEVRSFARQKNVRLWLWAPWRSLDRNDVYKTAFARFEQWGIAGVKVDFMERDDQEMVNWYEKIVRCAAEHHLMVDFHGAFKPTGMDRTFPNQITREGILGNEYNLFGDRITPEHKVTLPFTRLLAGPGDFTPGGFTNQQPGQFKSAARPVQVQGTRCSELALFVCYDSPFCCACDQPAVYQDQPGIDFLKIVPTVWDETRVPDGAVGEHLVVLRRHGRQWFLGALTDRNARDLVVKLDFLGPGRYALHLWKDAADSDIEATHLQTEQRLVTAADTLQLHLAKAGGAVAQFVPAP